MEGETENKRLLKCLSITLLYTFWGKKEISGKQKFENILLHAKKIINSQRIPKFNFPKIEDWKRTCLGIIHVASNRIHSVLKQFPDKRRPKGAIGGRRSRKSRWLDSIPRWLAGPFRRGSLTPADARSPSKKPVITEIIEGSRSTRDRDR